MNSDVRKLLQSVQSGEVSVDDALMRLKLSPFEDIGYAKVDLHRKIRQGAAEVIYGAGKTPEQIAGIVDTMLANGQQVADAGMVIEQNVMSFDDLLNYMYRDATQGDQYGIPTYGMYNLASNFTPAYDQSYEWTLDPDMIAQGYNLNRLLNESLDALSMNMVYGIESDDTEGYLSVWREFIARWNALLPEVPLYYNVYVTKYPDWLEGYTQDSFWDFQQAIVYCTVAE